MRVVRVLVYEGDPKWIESTMKQNAVKKYHQVSENNSITESIFGYQYPSVDMAKMDIFEASLIGEELSKGVG